MSIQKKKLSVSILFLVSALFLISFCSAVELNSTLIRSDGLNLSINITSPSIFFDTLIITNNSIYFEKLRTSNLALESITFNLTNVNKNYNGSQLPYFNQSSDTSKTLINGLGSINATIYITSGNIAQLFKITTSNGQEFTFPGATTNPVELDNVYLINGNTILTIENSKQISGICATGGLNLLDAVSLLGIILTVILIGGVLAMLVGVFSGFIDVNNIKNNLDLRTILVGVMTIGLTGLLLVTIAFIFNGAYCQAIGGV